MKKVLLSALLLGAIGANAQNVTIPDANFKAYLVGNALINTNSDSEIQVSEAAAFSGTINLFNQSIADLTGIENFTSLTVLSAGLNQITSLDVSNNVNLTSLYCNSNQLTSLDVSANINLVNFSCANNSGLGQIDVSNNVNLEIFDFSGIGATSIDLSANGALTELKCHNNALTSLDVTNNSNLNRLEFNNNQVATLDLSSNPLLGTLACHSNLLTTLNTASNPNLWQVYVQFNTFSDLDFSANTNLEFIYCEGNEMTDITIAPNAPLNELDCADNQFTALPDLSAYPLLTWLNCSENQLTSLNVANGNNTNFNIFNSTDNPNLTCIEVDDAAWSTTNWLQIDASTSFSENCCSIDNSISNVGLGSVELQAGETGATYQWIDCDNGNQFISGETTQYYEPSSNGNYACIIDNGSCSDTTDCFEVTTLGISALLASKITVAPNPTSQFVSVQSDVHIESVVISNVSGQFILETTSNKIDLSGLESGVYLLTISTEEGIVTKRIVKQ